MDRIYEQKCKKTTKKVSVSCYWDVKVLHFKMDDLMVQFIFLRIYYKACS